MRPYRRRARLVAIMLVLAVLAAGCAQSPANDAPGAAPSGDRSSAELTTTPVASAAVTASTRVASTTATLAAPSGPRAAAPHAAAPPPPTEKPSGDIPPLLDVKAPKPESIPLISQDELEPEVFEELLSDGGECAALYDYAREVTSCQVV